MANIIGTPLQNINDSDILSEVLKKIGENQEVLYKEIKKIVDFYNNVFAGTDPDTYFSSKILQGNVISVTLKSGVLYIYYKDGSEIKNIKFNLYPIKSSDSNSDEGNSVISSNGKGLVKLAGIVEDESNLPVAAPEGDLIAVGGKIYKYKNNAWTQLDTETVECSYYYYANKIYEFTNNTVNVIIDADVDLTSTLRNINTAIAGINTTLTGGNTPDAGLISKVNRLDESINGPANGTSQQKANSIIGRLNTLDNKLNGLSDKKDISIIPVKGITSSIPDNSYGTEGDYYFSSSTGIMRHNGTNWINYPEYSPSSDTSNDVRYPNTYIVMDNGLYRVLGVYGRYRLAKVAKHNVICINYWLTPDNQLQYVPEGAYRLSSGNRLYQYNNGSWDGPIPLDTDVLYWCKSSVVVGENNIVFPKVYCYDGNNLISYFEAFDAQITYLSSEITRLEALIAAGGNTGGFDDDDTDLDVELRENHNFLIHDLTTGNPGIFTINKAVEKITPTDIKNAYTIKTVTVNAQNKFTAQDIGLELPDSSDDVFTVGATNYIKLKEALEEGILIDGNRHQVQELVLDNMYPVILETGFWKSSSYQGVNPTYDQIIKVNHNLKISSTGTASDKGFIIGIWLFEIDGNLELENITIRREQSPSKKYVTISQASLSTYAGSAIIVNTQNHPDYLIVKNCKFIYGSTATYRRFGWVTTEMIPEDSNSFAFTDDNTLASTNNKVRDSYCINHIYFEKNVCQGRLFYTGQSLLKDSEGYSGLTILKSARFLNNTIYDISLASIGLGANNATGDGTNPNNVSTVYLQHCSISCPIYVAGNSFTGNKKLMTAFDFLKASGVSNGYYAAVLCEHRKFYFLHNRVSDFIVGALPRFDEHGNRIVRRIGTNYDVYANCHKVYFMNNTIENLVSYDRILLPNQAYGQPVRTDNNGNVIKDGNGNPIISTDPVGDAGTFKAKSYTFPAFWSSYRDELSDRIYKNNKYIFDKNKVIGYIRNTEYPMTREIVQDWCTQKRITNDIENTNYPLQDANFVNPEYLPDTLIEDYNGAKRIKENVTLTYLDVHNANVIMFNRMKEYIISNIDKLSRLNLDGPASTFADSNTASRRYFGRIEFSNNVVNYPVFGGVSGGGAWGAEEWHFNDNNITVNYIDSDQYDYRKECMDIDGNTFSVFNVEYISPDLEDNPDYAYWTLGRESPRLLEIKNNKISTNNITQGHCHICFVRASALSTSRVKNTIPKHDIEHPDLHDDTSTINIDISGNILQGIPYLAIKTCDINGGDTEGANAGYAIVLDNNENEYSVTANIE